MPGLDRLQILLPQGHIFSPGNPAAQFLVDPIDAAATAAFYIIGFVPFEDRKKEQAEVHVFHEYLVTPVTPADGTDHCLMKIQLFPAG